jgi:membrane-associated protein
VHDHVFDQLIELVTASAWTYAIVAGIVTADAVLPVVPGETAVITAGLLAANGELSIMLVVLSAALGAVMGDNLGWALGATAGERAVGLLARGRRARERVRWARDQLRTRGGVMVVAARFIPGGRTATTVAAGTLGMPWRRFVVADALGAGLWSVYSAMLGYLGGEVFKESLWKPLALAAVVAAILASAGEGWRRLRVP